MTGGTKRRERCDDVGRQRTPKSKQPNPWPAKMLALRKKLGEISQEEAAARLGVTRRAWIKWEADGVLPSPAFAKLIDQFCKHPEDFPKPE